MQPVIHWRHMTKCYGLWDSATAKFPHGRVVLSSAVQPKCGWRGVLLHELIHAQIGPDLDEHEDTKVEYHGPIFAAWCNTIGAQLGIPHVSVEDCWAWPWSCHFVAVEPASEG